MADENIMKFVTFSLVTTVVISCNLTMTMMTGARIYIFFKSKPNNSFIFQTMVVITWTKFTHSEMMKTTVNTGNEIKRVTKLHPIIILLFLSTSTKLPALFRIIIICIIMQIKSLKNKLTWSKQIKIL